MAARRGAASLRPVVRNLIQAKQAQHWSAPAGALLATPPQRSPITQSRCTRPAPVYQTVRYSSDQAFVGNEIPRTQLYNLHESYGAKFVTFGGYLMPVQYSDLSVGESHKWTREKASIFDVSHMVQHHFSGPGAAAFLETITPVNATGLQPHHSSLSVLLHPNTGGIVDDTIITKLADNEHFYVVTNAGCREKDAQYLTEQLANWHGKHEAEVKWEVLKDRGLIALQGPLSAEVLSNALPEASKDLTTLFFGQSRYLSFTLPTGQTVPDVLVSRGGYTGEDGFEISIPGDQTVAVTQMLLESAGPEKVRLAGLGARDSLRLEAGMCLYGHDLDDTTTPVEAGLSWVIPKERREKPTFLGAKTIIPQLKPKSKGGAGVSRRRVGLIVEKAPAREGAEIVDEKGEPVGRVTSGCPSPSLGKNVAMGYVRDGLHKSGTELEVVIRGKRRKAVVTKMPFIPSKYWKGGMTPG
ncbi:glycine cleavage system T protein [Saccharata proteae CBS 121410]|uniref:Aminomethyltransferase n=1 Tax=Saccharata proteae CBS 121410 TaxID=1314787 RepID=A0A9P4LVD4_9PEZI|nr:glycine cleavage system T protein [Saccharata proteae CBS 121410]